MAELVIAIGAVGASALARRFGGTTIYVPAQLSESHPIRAVLDDAAARALVECYGGERLAIPKQPERRQRVLDLHSRGGLTIAAIALETGLSERHVYRLLSRRDDRQLDMFGDPSTRPC